MGRPNPSYLKRQKEQARKERAEEKRAIRQGKKEKPVREGDNLNLPPDEAEAKEKE